MAETVLITGGGIIGIACAHYLSAAGYEVTVIDQGRIGAGCSHGNCGHICASHVLPLNEPANLRAAFASFFNPRIPFRLKPQWRVELWRWFWEFARRCNRNHMVTAGHALKTMLDSSIHEYRALFAAGDLDAQWQPRGLLYVLLTKRGLASFAKQDGFLRREFGVGAAQIDGSELSEFDPALRTDLAGGFYYEDDAFLRPDALTANWSSWLASRGVRFKERVRLESIEAEHGRVSRLHTDAGQMSADHYVFAAGAWSAQLASGLGCLVPVEPCKGYSVTLVRPQNCPSHAMMFAEHRVGATPFEDGFRLGSQMEFAGFDSSIRHRRIKQVVDSAQHYLREPAGEQILETWCGWRPMTWDSLPAIGRPPNIDNAVLATGHHMLGMSMAPATGRLVAELVAERAPHIDPIPFSPQRFN